jgi:cell division protein FtsB
MALMDELKRRARHVVGPVVGCLLVGYFSYHAIEGDRGVRAYFKLDRDIAEAQFTKNDVASHRAALEARVAMLSPGSLDTDLLEERARIVLGFVPSDSLVVGTGRAPSDRLVGLTTVSARVQ